MEKSKCQWGSGCEKDAEFREVITRTDGIRVTWLKLCADHHAQLGEIPVDYEKIEDA